MKNEFKKLKTKEVHVAATMTAITAMVFLYSTGKRPNEQKCNTLLCFHFQHRTQNNSKRHFLRTHRILISELDLLCCCCFLFQINSLFVVSHCYWLTSVAFTHYKHLLFRRLTQQFFFVLLLLFSHAHSYTKKNKTIEFYKPHSIKFNSKLSFRSHFACYRIYTHLEIYSPE